MRYVWIYARGILATNAELLHVNYETFLNFAQLAFDFVLKGKPIGIDYEFKKKDGTLFWVHIAGDVVPHQEEVVWTLVDITKEYIRHKEVLTLKERMDAALTGNKSGVWDLHLSSKYYLKKVF